MSGYWRIRKSRLFVVLIVVLVFQSSFAIGWKSPSPIIQHPSASTFYNPLLTVRGGSSEADSTTSDDDVSLTETISEVPTIGSVVSKAVLKLLTVTKRVICIGMDTFSKEGSVIHKVGSTCKQMLLAVFVDDQERTNFGKMLSQSYGVTLPTTDSGEIVVHGGSFQETLQLARSQGVLLVVFIPTSKQHANDETAVTSLLSQHVYKVTRQTAVKNANHQHSSFVLWGTPAKSSEATITMKRLKLKSKNKKSSNPTLVVVYPARSRDGRSVVPRLIAQHHCNPPPNAKKMASWLNALRKRHAKQYKSMHTELNEYSLYKERTKGYHDSLQADAQRDVLEEKAKQEQLLLQQQAKEEEERLQQRRVELLQLLPDEPDNNNKDCITIGLRFANGQTPNQQRRFLPTTKLNMLFNWIDATFELPRETIVLSTMNGQQTFTYTEEDNDDSELQELNFGKMTAFRVTVQESEDQEKEEEEAEEDNETETELDEYDEDDESSE